MKVERLGKTFDEYVNNYKRNLIASSLVKNDCNIGVTARVLQIHRNTITRYMHRLNIDINELKKGKHYD